jgi:serine/threonine-protein kinase RsbW
MQASHITRSERLVLRTSLAEIERVADWIDSSAQQAGLASDTVFAIQLCLEEAIVNVIMYGGSSEEMPISIELSLGRDGATAVIEDRGRPFDPTALPPRVKPASLDETRVGELGVHLIRNYSRAMRYERRDGRNRLTLAFDVTQTEAQK